MARSPAFFVWVLLIFIIVLGSLIRPIFLRPLNLRNVFLLQPIGIGIASLGQLVIILAGGIDLSMGSLVSLITTVMVVLYQNFPEIPVIVPFAIAIGIGLAAGLLNGTITQFLGVTPFIATFATGSMFQGAALFVSRRAGGGIPRSFRWVAEGRIIGIPTSVLLFAVVAIALALFLRRKKLGRHLFAVGSDGHISAISGINVTKVRFLSYVLGGILVGIASIYLTARLGGGGPLVGRGYELDSITANVIGGVALAGGGGTIIGVVGGILVITVFANLMNLFQLGGYTQTLLKGLILLIAVLVNARSNKG